MGRQSEDNGLGEQKQAKKFQANPVNLFVDLIRQSFEREINDDTSGTRDETGHAIRAGLEELV